MKLASCKSALNPPVVYSTDGSKAVVPVSVLLFVALWFILRFVLIHALCYFVLLFFSPFSIAILPRMGKRELILVFFIRLYDLRFFWFYLFPLRVREVLQIVTMALPGLFSYLLFSILYIKYTNNNTI